MRQYDANGQSNQVFRLDVVDGNAYKISSVPSNLIVEAEGAGTNYGTLVKLNNWSFGNHQKWDITPWGDGTYKLAPKHIPALLFDIEGTYVDNGAGVHLWGQHGGDNQRFYIQSTGCTGGPPPTGCTINRVRFKFRNVGDCCFDRLQGAKIQGSNDQSSWADLHTFTENGTGAWQEKTFTGGTYASVRFVAGPTGFGELYELEFYNGNTRLTGTGFGSAGGDANTGYQAAFDGNLSTQWHGPSAGSQNVAGLSLTGCSGGGCSAPVPTVSGGGNVCNGATVTLTASGCSGTYHWSNGVNGNSSIIVGAGTYSVTCEQGGCTSTSSSAVTVTANCGGTGNCVVNRVRFKFRNVGECCMNRLQGAKIQGSNDQSNWADLYISASNGTGDWQEFTFGNTTSYQYVRFLAGLEGYGELYELEFYNGTTRLTGTGFGTSGTDASNGYAAAFDGNVLTQWHGTFPGTNNYAGLSLSGCGSGGRLSASEAATEETGPEGLLLVPNPASDYVELRLPTGEQVRRAVCYDVQGRALIETTHARLYTGRLAGGTYLIRVETKAGRTYSRVLVKL